MFRSSVGDANETVVIATASRIELITQGFNWSCRKESPYRVEYPYVEDDCVGRGICSSRGCFVVRA